MTFRRTSLYPLHESAGATFTDFGGWEMPVSFDSIRAEHAAVRESAGKFDVSHMGQLAISGPGAGALAQRLTTNDVTELVAGEGQYTAITEPSGVMLDDALVYRLPAEREATFLVVPNAGHDAPVAERFREQRGSDRRKEPRNSERGAHATREQRDDLSLDARVDNRTTETAMIAVQGPDAPGLVAESSDANVAALSRFDMVGATVGGVEDALLARTGYTGEDGFEILCPWDEAPDLWEAFDCQPVGLGARDTLRLEMGFLLSGQDFHADDNPRTPYEAGIGFVVKLDTEFVGRDPLERQYEEGVEEKLTGFELIDRGVPREGYEVLTPDGDPLGTVTSGTVSPTLGDPIGMAYLPVEYAEPGRKIRVVVRDEPKKARTRTTPFLDR